MKIVHHCQDFSQYSTTGTGWKKEFATVAFDLENEIFVVYVTTLASSNSDIYPFRQVQIGFLKTDKAPTAVPNKYADLADVFLSNLVIELPKHTGINNLIINLINNK